MTGDGGGIGPLDVRGQSGLLSTRTREGWRLWGLQRDVRGALLALSFSREELRYFARRAGWEMPSKARDYEIQRRLYEACASRCTLSQLIEGVLDQKFANQIRALRGIHTGDALRENWREARGRGHDLHSLFWPFVSHPRATEELHKGFCADMHALSFNALSERRELLDRLEALEQRTRALQARSGEDVHGFAVPRGRSIEPDVSVGESWQERNALHPRGPKGRGRFRRRGQARQEIGDNALTAGHAGAPTSIPGVRIAYVGGLPDSIERIAAYWRERGAQFTHHCCMAVQLGGPLGQLLERADIVFYLVDCVSPEVGARLKAYCEGVEKALIPLDDAGLSGLHRALRTWCPLA